MIIRCWPFSTFTFKSGFTATNYVVDVKSGSVGTGSHNADYVVRGIAGNCELKTGMFRPEELDPSSDAVFVSSTPFDILPVRYIDDYEFNSSDNEILKMISKMYQEYTSEYIGAEKRALNG